MTQGGAERRLVTGIRFGFYTGRVSSYAGCNDMRGKYRLEGGHLVVTDLTSTAVACASPQMDDEPMVMSFIEARPALALDGDRLVLSSAETVMTFIDRRVADPDRPLIGTVWTVATLMAGGGAHPGPQDRASLLFAVDGSVAIDTGCNGGAARYALNGATIHVSAITMTKRACVGDDADLEQTMLEVLRSPSLSYHISARDLRLDGGAVGLVLVAR